MAEGRRIIPLKFWVDENGNLLHYRPFVKIALEFPATRPVMDFKVRLKAKGKHWLHGLPWPTKSRRKIEGR